MYVNSFSCQLHDVAWKIIISVKEGHLIFFLFGLNFSKISQYYSVIIIIISELIQKKKIGEATKSWALDGVATKWWKKNWAGSWIKGSYW